jgi:choline kinase|tara:strand:+ start:169 stop:921 length:753 start_codon:yes stop_codon:yes gene_type:complete
MEDIFVIDHALVLAAGHGSRLRDHVAVPHKALVQLEGEPLLLRTCRMLDRLGLREITIVTGHEGVALRSAIEGASGIEAKLGFIENTDWRLANGLSVLAAADVLERDYLLMMADHLLDPDMIAGMCRVELAAGEVVLAVDRKLDAIYDMDDATKVRLEGEHIVEIGKEIADYNAIDTGLFACGDALVACLAEVRAQKGDASLTDGMRVLIERKKFRALDIGPSWWQDVDTPGALAHGAKLLQENMGGDAS